MLYNSRFFPSHVKAWLLGSLFILPTLIMSGEMLPTQNRPSISLPHALEQVLRDYENAWKSGNASALASLFEEDGYVLSPGKPSVHGKSAIEAAYQTAGGDLYLRGIAYEISGPLAYIIGGYRMHPNGPDHGKFVLILRQTPDGIWKIVADMDNPNQGAPDNPPFEDQ